MDLRVINELARISAEHGGDLQAESVVEAARPRKSVLHSRFTWNNSKAAHQYRLEQARQLIRVTVQIVGPVNDPVKARVYVSLVQDRQRPGGGYRTTVSVMSNELLRAQLLEDALCELEHFQKKYQGLTELAGVFMAMRKVRRRKSAAA